MMSNQLLNDKFIRQRSEELQIPYENLFAASVLEEIVQKIAQSKYAKNFWMKNSEHLKLDNYRKKIDLNLNFYIKETEDFHYKKSEIGNFFAEIFRNYKREAIHWNYHITMDGGVIFIDIIATFSLWKIPVKIKLERVAQEHLIPYVRDIQLFSNNHRNVQIYCFPSEYVITEKFLEILDKLELINDMSCYLDIYEILKRDVLSGRKVWELLSEGCTQHGIAVEEKRLAMLSSYRTSSYMEKKWKAFLRRRNRKQPGWNDVMDMMERFFGIIWEHMCRNVVYLGDWMPELGRCID